MSVPFLGERQGFGHLLASSLSVDVRTVRSSFAESHVLN